MANDEGTCQIGEIAHPFLRRGNRNLASVHSLGQSSSLMIYEEEQLLFLDRAGESAAKLALVVPGAIRGEVVSRVQVRISQKIKAAAMKIIRSRFSRDDNLPTAVIAVFGIKVTR